MMMGNGTHNNIRTRKCYIYNALRIALRKIKEAFMYHG
jgi:hypothetical protein